MRCVLWTAAFALLALADASVALAGDIEDESFSLRLAAAQTRFSRYPDSAGLAGAGAGSPWSSSPNPASTGMNPAVGPRRWGTSAQYALLLFDAGTQVHVASLSGSYDAGRWGNWQPSVLGLTSNTATTRDGLDFEWQAVSVEVQWGRMVCRDLSIGVNVGYLSSEMTFDLGTLPVTETTSDSWTVRLGVLRKASERLTFGLAVEGSAAHAEGTLYDALGLGFGSMPLEDTTYSMLVRAGLYTFLTKDLTLYADYQLGYFTDDTGTLTTNRLFAGLDLTVVRGVYARAGMILDVEGNTSFSVGIGLAPSERVFIDVSYQYDMFPELDLEFGRGDTLGIGLSVLF